MSESEQVIQTASVTLSVYDWHLILRALERNMSIINWQDVNTTRLYEDISTQLCQMPVKVAK